MMQELANQTFDKIDIGASASVRPRVGLALGSGSARGWAHIGVIRALEAAGIHPDFVCGTSIGALVGAVYAAGELDRFEQWVLGLEIREVVAFMDVSFRSGLLKGELAGLKRYSATADWKALERAWEPAHETTGEDVYHRTGQQTELSVD